MRISKLILIVALLLAISSCSDSIFSSRESLLSYLEKQENGYSKASTNNGVEVTITYLPSDLLVQQELGEKYTEQKVKLLRERYEKHLYFILSFSKKNQEILTFSADNRRAFGDLVNKLSFGLEERIKLISNTDTIPIMEYIYPRMYGMDSSTDLLLVFPDREFLKKADTFRFWIDDLGIGTGEINIYFEAAPLQHQLKLEL